MYFDVSKWADDVTVKLKNNFPGRLLFVGLQGSHKRGEATPDSDIDLVVILDELTIDDLKKYKAIIGSMPENEKACGFISGKREINNWPTMDIFQFKNDTMPVFGSLDGLVPAVGREDIEAYIKVSSANLYHMAVHCYLYDKDAGNLKQIVKPLFFLLLAVYYLRTGVYVSSKKELRALLTNEEREILEMDVSRLSESGLEKMYEGILRYLSERFCAPEEGGHREYETESVAVQSSSSGR